MFPVLFYRVLVTHVEALTRWYSCGLLALVLMTGSRMAGALVLCMDWFLLGVGIGLAHYRCWVCCKNGGAFGGSFPS